MQKPALIKDPLTWVLVFALFFLIIGAVIPPVVENRARPLPANLSLEVASQPQRGLSADLAGFREGRQPERAAEPECQGEDARLACYIQETDMHYERATETALDPTEDSQVFSTSFLRFFTGDEAAAELTEATILSRESVYPIPGPESSLHLSVPALDANIDAEGFEREGLRYYFPSQTEQRSYPYFDPLLEDSHPLDYADNEELGAIATYKFHQSVAPQPLAGAALDALSTEGDAGRFYTADELTRYGLDAGERVELSPYYTVKRDVWVEPTTGTIMNISEETYLFLAGSNQQAQDMAEEPASDQRTVVSGHFTWDEASQARAVNYVNSTVTAIKVFAVIGWVGKIAAIILLILAGLMFIRRRSA